MLLGIWLNNTISIRFATTIMKLEETFAAV